MLRNADIHMYDPFVLSSASEKQYYLCGTIGSEAWTGATTDIDYCVGTELQNKSLAKCPDLCFAILSFYGLLVQHITLVLGGRIIKIASRGT